MKEYSTTNYTKKEVIIGSGKKNIVVKKKSIPEKRISKGCSGCSRRGR